MGLTVSCCSDYVVPALHGSKEKQGVCHLQLHENKRRQHYTAVSLPVNYVNSVNSANPANRICDGGLAKFELLFVDFERLDPGLGVDGGIRSLAAATDGPETGSSLGERGPR
jgi:hypothetical protein